MFALISLDSMAQDEIISSETVRTQPRQRNYYLFSPRLSVTVPHPLGNYSFKKVFIGVYELNGGFNLMLYKGLFAGVAIKNGLFEITPTKIPDYNASMSINGLAVKAGSDFYLGDKNNMILSADISVGQNNTKYLSFKCKDPKNHTLITGFKSSYIEPEVNLFFLIEPDFGIGATLTYNVISRNFDPYELCLNEWAPFGKDNSGSTNYISFGFGFYYGFSKRMTK